MKSPVISCARFGGTARAACDHLRMTRDLGRVGVLPDLDGMAALESAALLAALGVNGTGLAASEAAAVLEWEGPNTFGGSGRSWRAVLVSQLRSPLLGLLFVAAAVSIGVGESTSGGIISSSSWNQNPRRRKPRDPSHPDLEPERVIPKRPVTLTASCSSALPQQCKQMCKRTARHHTTPDVIRNTRNAKRHRTRQDRTALRDTQRHKSRSGGTGRRAGLKIRCPKGRVGSTPTFGIPKGLAFRPDPHPS